MCVCVIGELGKMAELIPTGSEVSRTKFMKVGCILLTFTCEIFTPLIALQQDPFMAHLIATLTSEGFTFDLILKSGCLVAACKQGASMALPSQSKPFVLTPHILLVFFASTCSIFFSFP